MGATVMRVYLLGGVEEDQVDGVAERIADTLLDLGFNADGHDDGSVQALIAVTPGDLPDDYDAEGLVRHLDAIGAASVVIPRPAQPDPTPSEQPDDPKTESKYLASEPVMPNMPEAESRVRKPAHNEQQGEEEARADDEALNSSGPACEARSETQADNSTYYCTRPAGHSGQHVAADAHKVVARWPAPDAPEVADPAHAPDCAIAEAGGRHGCTCEVAERPPEDTEEAPSRALGFNPWCCIECGPVPADEIDAIGGEHDYRHVIGHPEHEEPEAFRIDLSEWHLRAPAQPDTEGEDYVEREFWLLHCNSTIFDHLEVATRAPTPQPDTKGEGQAVFVSALDEKDHELLRDLANASPEASIIDLLVTEHAELLARVNRAPAPPQPPVSSEEDREVVRDWLKVLHSPPGLPAAIQAVLTDATTLASQHRGDR